MFLSDFESGVSDDEVSELFSTYCPGAVANRAQMSEPGKPLYRRYHVFRPQANRYFDRALSINEIRSDDPLVAVVKALAELEEGETLKYTFQSSMSLRPMPQKQNRVLTDQHGMLVSPDYGAHLNEKHRSRNW